MSHQKIRSISCGSYHTAFIDDFGKIYFCGSGRFGQLGTGAFSDEFSPTCITKIPDKVVEVACGDDFSLILG
jgi:alpha-tubulin suppressor-like RCC1 family protein